MSEISANKTIARNTIFMSARMVIILFLQLYTTRVILASLGVVDYGIYNVVCGFVSMFTFLSTAMTNGIQRFYNFEFGKNGEKGITSVYNTAVRVQGILAISLTVLIELIGLWYINNKMVIPSERLSAAIWVFHSSVLSLVLVVLQVPYSSVIIAKEKMDFYAIISVLNSVLNLVIAILVKYSANDRLILYGFLLSLIQVIILISYIIYSKKITSSLVLKKDYDHSLLRSMLGFSGWNIFGSFSSIMKEQGVNMILNLFCGPVVNAARGVAAQVNGGFQGLVSNLNIAVRPQVTKSYAQGNISRTMNLTYSISKLSCLVLFLFSYPILLELDFVLSVWLGDNIPEHTRMFVIITVMTAFFNNLNAAVSGVVHSSGKMKLYQISGSIVNLIALPISYILLKTGHFPEMVIWGIFVVAGLVQVNALLVLKTIVDYKISDYVKQVILPILLVIATSVILPYILHTILPYGVGRFLIVCTFTIIEISAISFFWGLSSVERNMLKSMLKEHLPHFQTK